MTFWIVSTPPFFTRPQRQEQQRSLNKLEIICSLYFNFNVLI